LLDKSASVLNNSSSTFPFLFILATWWLPNNLPLLRKPPLEVFLGERAKCSYDFGDGGGFIRDYGAGGVNVMSYTIDK